ncbi:MAG: peptide chain release factor aRF-1 [Candidatus Nanoarchaeia archaeon]|nr:peptide chain release factor aRF-1 [Candidatus Nanoarchaeia archaeon]
MDEKEKFKLEDFVERMKSYRARHTELITVYVPKDLDINIITKQLESEKSTAANIKSTSTRKNVQDALESLIRVCKQMKRAPKNGVALFAGNVSQVEGQADFITEIFEPPEELNIRLYRCDQTFVIDPLEEMLEIKELYGLIVIERKEATIGLLIGKKIKVLKHIDSFVPGKVRAGGQSSQRFHRITEGLAKDFYRKIADIVKSEFFNLKNLKGILVGGPGPTKEDFLKEGQLITALQDKVLAVKDIGYADEHGLELLVESSQDILAGQEIVHEQKILERFFNMLGKEREKTAYGKADVEKALSYGAVDVLFLSKKLKKEELKQYEKLAQETSTKVELISTDLDEGMQFWNLSGIGAILRFKIN